MNSEKFAEVAQGENGQYNLKALMSEDCGPQMRAWVRIPLLTGIFLAHLAGSKATTFFPNFAIHSQ